MIRTAFICAAWSAAERVREFHFSLSIIDIQPLSRWAEDAAPGAEDVTQLPPHVRYSAWHDNRYAIANADAVVILADTACREAFQEIEYARILSKPIVWIGRETLTPDAEFAKVARVATVEEAVRTLRQWNGGFEIGQPVTIPLEAFGVSSDAPARPSTLTVTAVDREAGVVTLTAEEE